MAQVCIISICNSFFNSRMCTLKELFGAMAAMFFLTIALEALKAFREWLQGWTLARYVKVEGESGDTKKPEGQNSSTR